MIAIGVLAAAIAGVVYLGLERLGSAGFGMAVLRTVGVASLALLLINPAGTMRVPDAPPTVLLDASLSLGAAGGRWREALDTARALAGKDGVMLRFGGRVAASDTTPPEDGSTRLADALRLAHGRPGPVVVVTDGEVEDAGTLEPSLLEGTGVVLVPRHVAPGAALLELAAPGRVGRGDSLALDLTIGTFGPLGARQARVEVALDGRVVARREVELPPAPGTARRRVALGPQRLAPGARWLSVRLVTPGDLEPGDDTRWRWLHVEDQPGVVVLASPADWEFRFLVRELSDIAPGAVRGYALVQSGRWVDMRTLAPVAASAVDEAVAGATVVVTAGARASRAGPRQAVWRWLPGDSTLATLAGDWYVSADVRPSPVAGRLGSGSWDSLPPLVGLVPVVPADAQWVALSARLARRGAERPVLLGWDSAGVRVLTVTGEGLWRWALRGGAAREAYRAMLASGLDWLLEGGRAAGPATVTATEAVPRGTPVAFRFTGDSVPDSLQVSVTDARSTRDLTLLFDAEGSALAWLAPGAYRWSVRDGARAAGVFVVEAYSDEFPPRAVTLAAGSGRLRAALAATYARQRPWLFALVILALAAEWIWRHRRGLP
ncbi:MAG: hypothetical protein HYV20_02915 [Gemmatimonadetes bacterium]|nr:hypothetical protein [Gemmatimonadota bacterium]